MIRIFYYLCICSAIISMSCNNTAVERKYYPDGKLLSESSIINGKKHGEMRAYYSDGKLAQISNWKNGLRHGKLVEYYKNDVTKKVCNYEEDHCVGELKYFYPNGNLKEVDIFNKYGRLMDFRQYDEGGKQLEGRDYRVAVFESQSDTISLGETFKATVRLGNRNFDSIEVHVLKLEGYNKDFAMEAFYDKTSKIQNLDSVTCYYENKPTKTGINHIEGIVFDIKRVKQNSSLKIQPVRFRHEFWVK